MPSDRPILLVTGATGAQGGSVARHLLAAGDLGGPASLGPALAGCAGVVSVTSFWEHFGGEEAHGRNLIDAVAAAGCGSSSSAPSPRTTR